MKDCPAICGDGAALAEFSSKARMEERAMELM